MLISKMQTYFSDKMPPKKVIIYKQKKWDFAKLDNRFLILTFFGGILSLGQISFFEFSTKFLIFLYPIWPTVFQEKNFTSQKGRFSNFVTQKPKKDRNGTK